MLRRIPISFFVLAVGYNVAFGADYEFGQGWRSKAESQAMVEDAQDSVAVLQGKPHKLVDGLGWVVGIPSKLMIWDRRVDNHRVTAATTDCVASYLDQNNLQDVCVRVNQYRPGQEWKRLRQNREIGAGWRYSVGALTVLRYTLLPGRVFGGDRYNPFTNSLHVYSDVPALALQAAAYSKDVHARKHPGAYATVNEFPVASLWHETRATRDSLDYLELVATPEEQIAGKRSLYPYYGMRVGGELSDFGLVPVGRLGGAVVGHAVSLWQTKRSNRELVLLGQGLESESAEPTEIAPTVCQVDYLAALR